MSEQPAHIGLADKIAVSTPRPLAVKIRGLSDRAICWLFVAPTIVLLMSALFVFAFLRRMLENRRPAPQM